MYKNNPRMHSTQQNKKTVLTAAAYFKVSTSVMSQRQKTLFILLLKQQNPNEETQKPFASVRQYGCF